MTEKNLEWLKDVSENQQEEGRRIVEKDPDWLKDVSETLMLASRLKRALLRKKKRRGWTKCPRCGSKVHAVLAGPRNHIHMGCENKECNVRCLE